MEEKVEFRKIRDFSGQIGDTFLFIKQNFKPLGKALLYLCGIFLAVGLASGIMTMLSLTDFTQEIKAGGAYRRSANSIFYGFLSQYALQIFLMMLCYTSIYTTVISYISLYISKKNIPPTIEEVWAYYKYYFFRILVASIGMGVLLIIGYFLCVIPGIYFFPVFTLFFPIMILENGSFGYSFSRAFALLKDNWWNTAAAILVIWIITYACTALIQMPGMIIGMVSAFSHAENPITKTYLIANTLSQYLGIIFMVIPIVCASLIYHNLTEQKESTGLMDRIGNLGAETTNTDKPAEEY